MKKFFGFTLSEMLLALVVLGVVFALTMSVTKNASNTTRMALKKANTTLSDVVQNLIDDSIYYQVGSTFADLNISKLPNGEPVSGESKFRRLFLNMVNLHSRFENGEILLCPVIVSNTLVQSDNECFMSADGIVWGIPNSDFKKKNTVQIQYRGYETDYLPITVYVNCKIDDGDANGVFRCQGSDDYDTYFDNNAAVFAVRRDGDIRPFSKYDCENSKYKELLQCKLSSIISDTSF